MCINTSYFPKITVLEASAQQSEIVPAGANCGISRLPNELLALIVSFLDRINVARAAQVCKKFFSIVNMDCNWRSLFQMCFPTIHPSTTTTFKVKEQFKLMYKCKNDLDDDLKNVKSEKKRIKSEIRRIVQEADQSLVDAIFTDPERTQIHLGNIDTRLSLACLEDCDNRKEQCDEKTGILNDEIRTFEQIMSNQEKFELFISSEEAKQPKNVVSAFFGLIKEKTIEILKSLFSKAVEENSLP